MHRVVALEKQQGNKFWTGVQYCHCCFSLAPGEGNFVSFVLPASSTLCSVVTWHFRWSCDSLLLQCLLLTLRGNWTREHCGVCSISTHVQCVFNNLSIWSETRAWKDPCTAIDFYITCSSGNSGSIGMVILCNITSPAEQFCCHLWEHRVLFNGLLHCTPRL